MGWVGAAAQCVLDFIARERCHACGGPSDAGFSNPPRGLHAPVEVASLAGIGLTTHVLCAPCAGKVRTWDGAVLVASHEGEPPLPVRAAFVTDERLLSVIHLLKFGRRERLAPWLARAMLGAIPPRNSLSSEDTLVVPVPMDRAARRRRGFNQAESIARILAAEWRLPLSSHALLKVRRTHPQSALGRKARLANLAGAFRADASQVDERTIILVDDLVTTGSTAHACAVALRRAGARELSVVCAGYRDESAPGQGPFPHS